MKSKFKIENPDSVIATLSVSMPLKDWKALREQMAKMDWPAWEFAQTIGELVTDAEQAFYRSSEE